MRRNFTIGVLTRAVLILLSCLHFAYAILTEQSVLSPIVPIAFLIMVASVYYLIKYVEKTNAVFANLLLSIRQGEFTTEYKLKGSRKFIQINKALNAVLKEFQKISYERESYYRFLEILNENLQVAIICVDDHDEVIQINQTAKSLLDNHLIRSIDDLKGKYDDLYHNIKKSASGDTKVLQFQKSGHQVELLVQTKEAIIQNKYVRLILLHNITQALDDKQLRSWQELTSVLTHEIMNSIAPIVSLSGDVNKLLLDKNGNHKKPEQLSPDELEDLYHGLRTIHSRSRALTDFVRAYKKFSTNPQLHLVSYNWIALVSETVNFVKQKAIQDNIVINLHTSAVEINSKIDYVLLEQVMINLLNNAIESFQDKVTRVIDVDVKVISGKIVTSISDTGQGIDADTLPRIFIPFFTTKKSGTGIGLSLCKQIIVLHSGRISVQSTFGVGTTFTIEMPVQPLL